MDTRFDELLDFFCNKKKISDEVKNDFKNFCRDYEDFDDDSSTIEDIEFWWQEYEDHSTFEE